MKQKTFLLALVILLTSFLQLYSQIEFELTNGEIINGFIVENKTDSLKIKTVDNFFITVPKKIIVGFETIDATITTKSGDVYEGNITDVNESQYILTTESGLSVNIPRYTIENVFLGNNYREKQYAMFGPTLIFPGGINLLFGYHFSTFAVRGEFGFFPVENAMYGLQVNIMYNLFRNKSFEHNISIAGGFTNKEETYAIDKEWTYLGFMYDFNIYGFFMEIGLSIGSGTYTNPQLLGQIGYVYRFND